MAYEVSVTFTPNRGVQTQAFNFVVRFLLFYRNMIFNDENPAPVIKMFLSGGLGSGKTYSGSCFTVIIVLWIVEKYPDEQSYDFMIVAPTYDLAIRVCCKTLRGNLVQQGFRPGKDFRYLKNDKTVLLKGRICFRFISADNPENIAGDNVIGVWGDEIDLMKPEALRRMFARVRYGGRRVIKFMLLTGTPEIGNDAVEDIVSDFKTFLLPTLENIKFVGDDYIRTLRRSFTPEEQKCYLFGMRVRIMSELVFYSFSRERNVVPPEVVEREGFNKIFTDRDLFVGMDFNVNPFVASIFQRHRVKYLENSPSDYKEAYLLKRVIELKNLMIHDMVDAIEELYFAKGGRGKIICTPDSNKGRDTGSPYSPFSEKAYEYEYMENRPGWELFRETRNPAIYRSCSIFNSQFRQQNILFIENESTRKTVNIFNVIKWINNKMDETIKHYIDAPRYFVWNRYNDIYGTDIGENGAGRNRRR